MRILADLHTHTKFSVDGKDEIKDMCRAAIEKGLNYIAFTEHLDLNPRDEGYGYFKYAEFSRSIESARDEFGDRIHILKGLEFSEPHLYPQEYESMLKQDFDVVLAGVHWLGDNFVGDKTLREEFTTEQIFQEYYDQVLQAVRLGGFDALAHLDFPKRYLKASCEATERVDAIVRELARRDIALEINTSPLRKGLDECAPDVDVLERYTQAGGTKITVGSDAHSCSEIAAGFEYAYRLVEKSGVGCVGVFESHKFIPILDYLTT